MNPVKINFKNKLSVNKGVTLIETILYLATFSIFLVVLVVFWQVLNNNYQRIRLTGELDRQGQLIIRELTREIRQAKEIIEPSAGNDSSKLILLDNNSREISFEFIDNNVLLKRGDKELSLIRQPVSSEGVFNNISRIDDSQILQIEFVLSFADLYIYQLLDQIELPVNITLGLRVND